MLRICWGSSRYHSDWGSLLRSYKRHVRDGHAVLEIGASSADKTRQLAALCRELVGVEIDPARKPPDSGNIRYVLGDWQELSKILPAESFDLAVASHTIEHVPDDLKALRELHAILKPGGVALFNTPNRQRLSRRILDLITGERKFPYWEHVREYTEQDLRKLIDASPFKRYTVQPVALGLHSWRFFCYSDKVPRFWAGLAQFWEVHLFKD